MSTFAIYVHMANSQQHELHVTRQTTMAEIKRVLHKLESKLEIHDICLRRFGVDLLDHHTMSDHGIHEYSVLWHMPKAEWQEMFGSANKGSPNTHVTSTATRVAPT